MDAQELTSSIIYLMGGSFLVGSLFTLLLLVLLEMIRSNSAQEPPSEEP